MIEPIFVAIVLDVVASAEDAVRKFGQSLAQLTLGGVDLLFHDRLDSVRPIPIQQFAELAGSDVVGCDHRLQIEAKHLRQTCHAHDHLPKVLAQNAALDELDARKQHGLLLDFRCSNRPGAETHSSDVELVSA